jgi:hypothetical protein
MVDAPASKAGAEQAWGFESPLRHHRLTVRFRNILGYWRCPALTGQFS